MTSPNVEEIVTRNLINAHAQSAPKDRKDVLRFLLLFAQDAGVVDLEPGFSFATTCCAFGTVRELNIAELAKLIHYQEPDYDKVRIAFKQSLVKLLEYGGRAMRKKAGTALLVLAADLGILARQEELFLRYTDMLNTPLSYLTSEGIEAYVTRIESYCGQSTPE